MNRYIYCMSWDSSVQWWTYRLRNWPFNYHQGQGQRLFFSTPSRPALGPTHPPIQRVPWTLYPGVKSGRDVKMTTHLNLVPWLRMRGAILPLLYVFMTWWLV